MRERIRFRKASREAPQDASPAKLEAITISFFFNQQTRRTTRIFPDFFLSEKEQPRDLVLLHCSPSGQYTVQKT
jgi:hypothetical protein